MAGNLRDVSIGVEWQLKYGTLREANELTDQLIHNGERMEQAVKFDGHSLSGGLARLKETDAKITSTKEKLASLSGAGEKAGSGIATGLTKSSEAAAKLTSPIDRIKEKLAGLTGAGERAGAGIDSGFAKASAAVTKPIGKLDQLKAALTKVNAEGKEAGVGIAAGADRGAGAYDKATASVKKYLNTLKEANNVGKSLGNGLGGGLGMGAGAAYMAGSGEKQPGKLRSAVGDGLAMFAPGMLAASGVMAAFEGVKSAFAGGWKQLQEKQSGQAMWATSIEDAHGNMSAARLASQSRAANQQILETSLRAGNDFTEGNAIAKQIYSSDAGAYSGNTTLTNRMLKGMFNIQDANALNGREMEMFKMAVGNIGDTGKMSGGIARSLNLLDGKITRRIRQQYKKETGHELGKNKAGGWDYSAVSAETAFKAIDGYGNSGGLAKASERYNSTLPGMLRSAKSASNTFLSEMMENFGKNIAKGGAFRDIIGNLSKTFTNFNKINSAARNAAGGLSGVANALGQVIKAVTPFASGFVSGFASTISSIKKALSSAFSFIGDIGKKIEGMLPKGTGNKIQELVTGFGKLAGGISAIALSIKGATKLPLIGKTIGRIVSKLGELTHLNKIPGLSKFFSNLTGGGKNGALNANTSALNRLTGALSGKNSTGGTLGSDAGDYIDPETGEHRGVSTRGNKKYNKLRSKYERQLEQYGAGSSQAEKARRKLNNYGAKNERKLERIGRRYGKHSSKYVNAAQEYATMRGGISTAEQAIPEAQATSRLARTRMKGGRFGAIGRFGSRALGMFSGLGGKIGGSRLFGGLGKVGGVLGKGGKFLGRGMPGINALFAGLDIFDAMNSTKKGSKSRHMKVGSAVGGGVGATIGGALGSFLGPMGTLAGAMGGQWLGDKAGGFVGKNWKGISSGFSKGWNGLVKGSQGVAKGIGNFIGTASKKGYSLGGKISKIPGLGLFGKQMQFLANPMKTVKGTIKDVQGMFNKVTHFKMPKISIPKFKMPKLANFKNPFKGWKMPKFKMPKLPKIKNPFKGWKLPKFKMPKLSHFKNPFKGWKIPKLKMPKLPKIKNPFKNWHMPKWAQGFAKWFGGAEKANKSTKKASKSTKDTEKSVSKVGKKSESSFSKLGKAASAAWKKVSKGSKNFGKDFSKTFSKMSSETSKGMNKAKRAASKGSKGIAKSIKNGLKDVSKDSKSAFNGLSKNVKSGMNKAKRTAKSGGKGITKAVKSSMKDLGKSSKSAFNSLNKNVRSGMNKAKRTAKSSSKGIAKAVTSSLKNIGKGSKNSFNGLVKNVRSGMNKAKRAAQTGGRGISKAVTNSLKNVSRGSRSSFNGLVKNVQSGMNRAKRAAQTGGRGISNAVKSSLRNVSKGSSSAFNGLAKNVQSGMNRAASAARSGASRISSSIKSGLSKASSSAKSELSKVAEAVQSGMSKAASAATSGSNKIVSSIKNGMSKATSTMKSAMNNMVSSANAATSKVAASFSKIGSSADNAASRVRALASAINSLHSKTVTITADVKGKGASKLAHGTPGARSAFSSVKAYAAGGSHAGGPALVNDVSNSTYREAFMLPNGLTGLFPAKRNILVDLPAGSHVLDAEETKRRFAPKYALGTSKAGEAFNNLLAKKDKENKPADNKTTNNKVEININPTVNVSVTGGSNVDQIRKQVVDIVMQQMDQMGATLQSKLGLP